MNCIIFVYVAVYYCLLFLLYGGAWACIVSETNNSCSMLFSKSFLLLLCQPGRLMVYSVIEDTAKYVIICFNYKEEMGLTINFTKIKYITKDPDGIYIN